MSTITTTLHRRTALGTALDVMVTDDHPGDNLLLAMAAHDAKVDVAFTFLADGEELIDALRRRSHAGALPDLIVLDLRMPRCSGFEVLEVLAADPALRTVPVVMFTVSRRDADVQRGLALGATRFVTKPNSYPGLMAFARELVEVARASGDADVVVSPIEPDDGP